MNKDSSLRKAILIQNFTVGINRKNVPTYFKENFSAKNLPSAGVPVEGLEPVIVLTPADSVRHAR